MGDVASLAVGLHLNAANFKSQLMSAYGSAESQSRQFNRNAQADAKKTEDAYKRVSASVSGLAGRLAGFAGAGLSLGTIISTTRQYSQSLSDLQAITGATSAQMKLYDQAAQEMGRTTEYSASQAAEAIKLMASAKPELLSTSAGLTAATKSALTLAQAAGTTLPDATRTLALSLNQFGAGASEADRYINVLAAGAKFGSSEITVVRRVVYARFLDAVNFTGGNPEADPEQEVVSRWVIEQLSELKATTATFVLATPTETDGSVFPARIMLADVCNWTYRSQECGYAGPPVADEFDKPTADPAKDACSKCRTGCELRNNLPRIGCFLSINRLS